MCSWRGSGWARRSGLILLAVVTNLPEIAITASASLSGELGIAVGNILGGIAIQTAVLVLVDAFGVRGVRSLSYRAASLSLVLEGTLVIIVLAVTVMSSQLPSSVIFGRVTPGGSSSSCAGWSALCCSTRPKASALVGGAGAPGSQRVPKGTARARKDRDARNKGISTTQTLAFFAVASVITLIAGAALEQSGEIIAGRIGMNGILFGSTVLAAATPCPRSRPASPLPSLATTSSQSATSSEATPFCPCCSSWRGSSPAKPSFQSSGIRTCTSSA